MHLHSGCVSDDFQDQTSDHTCQEAPGAITNTEEDLDEE